MKFRINDDKKIYSSLEEAVDEALKTKKKFSLEMFRGRTVIIKISINPEADKLSIMRALQIHEIISRLFLIKNMFIALDKGDGFFKHDELSKNIIENFTKKFLPLSDKTLQEGLEALYVKGDRKELYQYLNEPKNEGVLKLFQEEIVKLEVVALAYNEHPNKLLLEKKKDAKQFDELWTQQKEQLLKKKQDKKLFEKQYITATMKQTKTNQPVNPEGGVAEGFVKTKRITTVTRKQPKTNTTTENNQSVSPERVVAEGTVKKQSSQKTLSGKRPTDSNQVKELEEVLNELRQGLTQTVKDNKATTDGSANPISKKPLPISEQHNLVSKALAELLSMKDKDLPLAQKKAEAKKIIEGLLPKITSNKELLQLSELIKQKHTSYDYLREEQSWWRFQSHGNTTTWSAIIGDIKKRMDENTAGCENETYSKDEYKQFLTIMNEHRGRGFGSVTHSKMYRQMDEIPADEEQIQIKPFK